MKRRGKFIGFEKFLFQVKRSREVKMKRKALFSFFMIVLFVGIIFGGPGVTAAQDRFVYACFRVGTSFYFEAIGVTQLLNQYANLTAIVQPYPAPPAVFKALHDKKADMISQNKRWSHDYTYGDTSVLKHAKFYPETRAVMGSSHVPFGWVTRPDTGINTISDLRGRNVTFKIPGLTMSPMMAEASLEAAGIDPEKGVKHVPFPNSPAAAKGLKGKKIDAMWGALGTSYIQEVQATVGLSVISFPPDVFEKLSPVLQDTYSLRELPAGYYTTLDKKTYVAGLPSVIITRDDVSEDIVYQVLKLTTEHAKTTQRIHQLFREHGKPEYQITKNFNVPFHNGALRYFKEVGIWTPTYEARQSQLLEELQKKVQASK